MTSRRRLLAGVAVLLAFIAIQGCDVTSNVKDSQDCAAASYDLRTPPTRAEVGMEPGSSFANKACDAGFELTLNLPEDTTTSLTARRVNADSYHADQPKTDPPTTMDVHSVALGTTAEAVRTTTRVANDLGIDPTPLTAWAQRVDAGSGGSIDSPFLRTTLGYLTAELQVQHLGTSGTNFLHLVLTWS